MIASVYLTQLCCTIIFFFHFLQPASLDSQNTKFAMFDNNCSFFSTLIITVYDIIINVHANVVH